MVSQAEREQLLAQQTRALRALTFPHACTDAFEPRELVAVREALVRKRVCSLARHWPALRLSLGECFQDSARDYVLNSPRLTSDSRADGRGFATWLGEHGNLPGDAATELLRFDAGYYVVAGRVRRRRLPVLLGRRRPRLMAAVSLPRPGLRPPLVGVLAAPRLKKEASRRPRPAP